MSKPDGAMGSPYCDGSMTEFLKGSTVKECDVTRTGFNPPRNNPPPPPPPPPPQPIIDKLDIDSEIARMEANLLKLKQAAADKAKAEKEAKEAEEAKKLSELNKPMSIGKFSVDDTKRILNTIIPNGYTVLEISDEKIVFKDKEGKLFTMYPNQ